MTNRSRPNPHELNFRISTPGVDSEYSDTAKNAGNRAKHLAKTAEYPVRVYEREGLGWGWVEVGFHAGTD